MYLLGYTGTVVMIYQRRLNESKIKDSLTLVPSSADADEKKKMLYSPRPPTASPITPHGD